MADVTAFERQVADEMFRIVGPARPVDDLAVFEAAVTASPKWGLQSMLGTTKVVVAGAFVALFGGLLLAGVLTTQPSEDQMPSVGASASAEATPTDSTAEPQPTLEPDRTETPSTTARSDILPGVDLVTEEVEPGVYRVVSDGVRDLVAGPPRVLALSPGRDVVLFTEADGEPGVLQRFYTLGERGEEVLGADGGDIYWFDAALDDAGNLIARLEDDSGWQFGRFGYFDGDAWTEPTWPNGSAKVSAVEFAPDGAAWVTRASTGPWPRVARIEDGDWTVLPMIDDGSSGRYLGGPDNFAVAPDGTVWFASNDGSGSRLLKGTKGLLHFDGQRWLVPELPIEPAIGQFGPLAIGPDGTLWVHASEGPFTDLPPYLLRLRDGVWTVFTEADGVPRLVGAQVFGARLAVDGVGTLWIAFDGDPNHPRTLPPPLGSSDPPHGVLSFDGSTWRQYLKGHHVNRVEVAGDGSVWATSQFDCTDVPMETCGEQGPDGLYVITPEAVAGGA